MKTKDNDELKDELRTAATLAVGPTEGERAFWDEVDSYLSPSGETPRKSGIAIEPRLTPKP